MQFWSQFHPPILSGHGVSAGALCSWGLKKNFDVKVEGTQIEVRLANIGPLAELLGKKRGICRKPPSWLPGKRSTVLRKR